MSTLCVLGVRPDDVAHQPVAHDVPVSQIAEPDPFDPGEDPLDLEQSGILSVGQVDLRLVTRDHRARVHAQARRNIFICMRSEEHTSELQSLAYLVCRLLLEKKKKKESLRPSHKRTHR